MIWNYRRKRNYTEFIRHLLSSGFASVDESAARSGDALNPEAIHPVTHRTGNYRNGWGLFVPLEVEDFDIGLSCLHEELTNCAFSDCLRSLGTSHGRVRTAAGKFHSMNTLDMRIVAFERDPTVYKYNIFCINYPFSLFIQFFLLEIKIILSVT